MGTGRGATAALSGALVDAVLARLLALPATPSAIDEASAPLLLLLAPAPLAPFQMMCFQRHAAPRWQLPHWYLRQMSSGISLSTSEAGTSSPASGRFFCHSGRRELSPSLGGAMCAHLQAAPRAHLPVRPKS